MTDHPVLIPTTAGVLGGVVTEPDRTAASAAAVILHGAGSTRAGTNQIWAGAARALADLGVVTFRIDYPGYGESHAAEPTHQRAAVSHALTWFRERVPDLGLLVVGVCAGVIPAADLALADGRTRGFAAITPPMFPPHGAATTRAPSLARRVYRARRLPKRAYLRVRYGVRRPRKPPGGGALERAPGALLVLTERMPVWILTGELDAMTPAVLELAPALHAAGSCRIDVVEGMALYSYPSPLSQVVQHERTLAWARATLQSELAR